jgi:hypothetical protein
MRHLLKFVPLAGAALLVAACGGTAANNTANAVDNGTVVTNDTMAPDLNAPMPDANAPMANDMNGATTTTTNTTTTTSNTTNHM